MRKLVAVVLVCAAASGCATIRIVKSQPGKGGVIALSGPMDEAKQKAMTAAKQNCGGKKVKVVEEGETKVGSKTTGATKGGKKSGDSTVESESTDKTEWRLTYKCAKK